MGHNWYILNIYNTTCCHRLKLSTLRLWCLVAGKELSNSHQYIPQGASWVHSSAEFKGCFRFTRLTSVWRLMGLGLVCKTSCIFLAVLADNAHYTRDFRLFSDDSSVRAVVFPGGFEAVWIRIIIWRFRGGAPSPDDASPNRSEDALVDH